MKEAFFMQIRNTDATYGVVSKSLHWIIGLAIIGLLAVGLFMVRIEPTPDKWQLYGLHKATGIVVLALVFGRIIWRKINLSPTLPNDMKAIEKIGAHAGHLALYIFMLGMPLSGWAMSSAGGHGVSIYGLFDMPALVGENKDLGRTFNQIHEYMSYALIATIAVHMLAGFYHHFIRKDNVLRRMLP